MNIGRVFMINDEGRVVRTKEFVDLERVGPCFETQKLCVDSDADDQYGLNEAYLDFFEDDQT